MAPSFLFFKIFKVFIEFVTTLLLLPVLMFWPQGMWGLSSLTKAGIPISCVGRQSLTHWTDREVQVSYILDWISLRMQVPSLREVWKKSRWVGEWERKWQKGKVDFKQENRPAVWKIRDPTMDFQLIKKKKSQLIGRFLRIRAVTFLLVLADKFWRQWYWKLGVSSRRGEKEKK